MATVVTFRTKEKPRPRIWKCDCGCEVYWLYEDGQVECAECNTFHDAVTGYWQLIDPDGAA